MSFAPRLMIPVHSCSVPGRKPGTSTKVRTGMLNALQVRTKRAAFSDALMSRQPARCRGWLATIPTLAPSMRLKPTTMLGANASWTSTRPISSTTSAITSRMS